MKKSILAVLMCSLCVSAFALENATLSFYQRQAVSKSTNSKQDRAFALALAQDLASWIRLNEQNPEVKAALLMQTDLYQRAKDEAQALLSVYKVRYYFPSGSDLALLSSGVETNMEEIDRRQKAQALKLLAVDTSSATTLEQRKMMLLEQLVKGNLSDMYQPVCKMFEEFFEQYPTSAHLDKMTLLYGDWHRQNGNYLAAITEYKKVHELFANTPYKAASLRMTADVYASNLKEYETAASLYAQVLKQYPDSAERGIVYKHWAVMEENLNHYDTALNYYDKAINDLGVKPVAYEAWTGKADVLQKTREYQMAYDTLMQGAAVFSKDEDKYVSLLAQAAEIARRRLRDPVQEQAALDQALLAYPQTQRAPELMYTLAQSYEHTDKSAQALAAYKRLIVQFPTDKYAGKAQSRVTRIEK